jgi:hypothetical protein
MLILLGVHVATGDQGGRQGPRWVSLCFLPRPAVNISIPCYAGLHTFDGNGELTACYQIKDWEYTNKYCLSSLSHIYLILKKSLVFAAVTQPYCHFTPNSFPFHILLAPNQYHPLRAQQKNDRS